MLLAALAVTGCQRPAKAPTPTFNNDVAPILFKHCVRLSPAGTTGAVHADVLSGRAVAGSAESPRPRRAGACRRGCPIPGQPAFVGERSLPAADIDDHPALGGGRSAGGRCAAICRRCRHGREAGSLGSPIWSPHCPSPTCCRPGEHDVYRNLVLRISLPAARFVRAIEFRPGDAPIHHAVIRIDRTRTSRARDGVDGQPGFDGMVAYEVQDPDGHFLGWAPGRGPIVAPERTAVGPRSRQRSDRRAASDAGHGVAGAVQPSVGLFFTDRAPADHAGDDRDGLEGDRHSCRARATIRSRTAINCPSTHEVLSVYPHAHYLGREMDVRATLPDGTTTPLIHIRRWSFQLAAGLPVGDADARCRVARTIVAEVHVRQLGGEPAQSASTLRAA